MIWRTDFLRINSSEGYTYENYILSHKNNSLMERILPNVRKPKNSKKFKLYDQSEPIPQTYFVNDKISFNTILLDNEP